MLVEKPLALTLSDTDELIALAEKKAVALGVFYEMRYALGFCRARRNDSRERVGQNRRDSDSDINRQAPLYWQVGYNGRSSNGWRGEKARAGGGVTLMNTSHLLDALWYIWVERHACYGRNGNAGRRGGG